MQTTLERLLGLKGVLALRRLRALFLAERLLPFAPGVCDPAALQ